MTWWCWIGSGDVLQWDWVVICSKGLHCEFGEVILCWGCFLGGVRGDLEWREVMLRGGENYQCRGNG